MSGNKWSATKVNAKVLSDLGSFSMLSSEILLDFHESVQ